MTILRVGKLSSEKGQELCLVRNISAGGLMAHVYSQHAVDESVIVELQNGKPMTGAVQWVLDSNIGIRFDTRINVGETLSVRPLGSGSLRPRQPRIEQACRARLRIGTDRAPATLLDISQGGAKIETDYPLFENDRLVLTMPNFRPVEAVVRWAKASRFGVEFNRPLAYAELTDWLRNTFR